jgi:hypothetical protein
LAGGWFDKIVNFLGYSDQEEELESFEELSSPHQSMPEH